MSVTITELRDALSQFARERHGWPREDVEREFGELVLCMLQQSDRLGIDLASAGAAGIRRRAAGSPAPGDANGAPPTDPASAA